MRRLLWLPWLPIHAAVAVSALLARAAAPPPVLLFTHDRDQDARGQDQQMGPLAEGLIARRIPFAEVSLIPAGHALPRALFRKRRLLIPWAPFLALARVVSLLRRSGERSARTRTLHRARRRVAGLLIRVLRPRVLFLIDESGSGQPLLQAARIAGIPVVGVQHGDFHPGAGQYVPARSGTPGVEPADALAVWSPWFRDRLIRISPIYDERNVHVTGRLRFPEEAGATPSPGPRVLVVRGGHGEDVILAPFVDVLRSTDGIEVAELPHPRDGGRDREPRAAMRRARFAIGCGSSALLEAAWHGCVPVIVGRGSEVDPGRYGRSGVALRAETPAALVELLARPWDENRKAARTCRDRVWDGAPEDPVGALLALADGLVSGDVRPLERSLFLTRSSESGR